MTVQGKWNNRSHEARKLVSVSLDRLSYSFEKSPVFSTSKNLIYCADFVYFVFRRNFVQFNRILHS